MKKLILAAIILATSQNVMAWGVSDLTSTTDKVNEATKTVNDTTKKAEDGVKKAKEVQAAADKVQKKGLTETATVVAKEGGKGALVGAAEGVATGTVVDSGTKGGVDAGKKALSGFGF